MTRRPSLVPDHEHNEYTDNFGCPFPGCDLPPLDEREAPESDPPTLRPVTVSAKEYARGAAIRRYLTERGATILPTRIR